MGNTKHAYFTPNRPSLVEVCGPVKGVKVIFFLNFSGRSLNISFSLNWSGPKLRTAARAAMTHCHFQFRFGGRPLPATGLTRYGTVRP